MLPFAEKILSLAIPKKYTKGTFLAEANTRTKSLFFMQKGIVRHFYLLAGKEITSSFSVENDFFSTMSFFAQSFNQEYLIALEDVEVLEISRTHLYELYSQEPITERFGRLLLEQHLAHLETLFLSLSEKSAKERYQIFEKQYPHLLQRVSLGNIASFLDMSQETLSRIRAKKE